MNNILQLRDLVARDDFNMLLNNELKLAQSELETANVLDVPAAQGKVQLIRKLMRLKEQVKKAQ